jgi:hypothetical protein
MNTELAEQPEAGVPRTITFVKRRWFPLVPSSAASAATLHLHAAPSAEPIEYAVTATVSPAGRSLPAAAAQESTRSESDATAAHHHSTRAFAPTRTAIWSTDSDSSGDHWTLFAD